MALDPPAADYEVSPAPFVPAILPVERVAAAFEVLLCSGFPTQLLIVLVLASFGWQPRTPSGALSLRYVVALTLLDTVLVVGLIAFFFAAKRESFRAQLFGGSLEKRDVVLGFALIPASFFVVIVALAVVQLVAPGLHNVPQNPFADLAKTRLDAAVFAFVVMVAGGVREEIQRGFILRRFEQYLGGGAVGLAVFSLLFGLGHLEQGRDIAIATGALGAFWGAIFLRRRTILPPMIGHAGFNLAQILKFLVLGA